MRTTVSFSRRKFSRRSAAMAPPSFNGVTLPDTPISTVLVVVASAGLYVLLVRMWEDFSTEALWTEIAMQAEIAPLVENLQLVEDSVSIFPAGMPWVKYSGTHKNLKVHAVTPGKCEAYGVDHVGTVSASLLTYAASQALKPDLIINAGTAGGFKRKGAQIGDIFLATETANHDRRIPIGNFVAYGIDALQATPAPNLVKKLSLKEGKLSTGNSLDIVPADEKIILANDASLKDMEGAAVAYVADHLSIPLILIKVVSDIVDGDRPTTEEFRENLSTAADALKCTVPKVLEYLSECTLSTL